MQKNSTHKKRGRKPKGGKIINQNINKVDILDKPENIILHLICKTSDISSKDFNITPYNHPSKYSSFKETNKHSSSVNDKSSNANTNDYSIINEKLKELQYNLHTNNCTNKKSACFCCTCDFDSPVIYIPKGIKDNKYNVYGCFCSPECATYYLFNENISSSIQFERYSLLNLMYNDIYKYENNIKPAPNPHYMLDKFMGNLSITEYRKLLRNNRFLYISNKPLTNILPELHLEYVSNFNDKHNFNNNNLKIKKKSKKDKSEVLYNNFNF
jgi:hypothetical protein